MVSRRSFIKISAIATGGILVELSYPVLSHLESQKDHVQLNRYLTFNDNGSVTYRDTKPEMGQGSGTGIAMIVCEELGADWKKFHIEKPPLTNQMGPIEHSLDSSAGSNAILAAYIPIREATAIARQMILNAASAKLGLSASKCFCQRSIVYNTFDQRSISFASVFPLLLKQPIPKTAKLKSPDSFYLIGKEISFRENQAIVQGKQDYSIDVVRPEMVFATIKRSPTTDGVIEHKNTDNTLNTNGVIKVIDMPAFPHRFSNESSWQEKYRGTKSGVAVIANSTWAAIQGKNGLDIQWSKSKYHNFDDRKLKESLRQSSEENTRIVKSSGNSLEIIRQSRSDRIFSEQYFNPYQENAQMEPLNAVAEFDGKNLTIWAGSQSPTQATDYVSSITGIPLDNITIYSMRSGGGFGRRYFYDFIAEVAYIAIQIKKPVKLMWTREDCIQHGRYHLARYDKNTIVLDDDNNILVWDCLITSGNNYGYIGRNIIMDYYAANTAHRSTRHQENKEQALLPGSWRSVDAHPMTLACECFVDEIAVRLKIDPITLRLQWLASNAKDVKGATPDDIKKISDRQALLKNVLNQAKIFSEWGEPLKSNQGKGISLSYFYGTTVSQVAYVSVKEESATIDKIVCVIDCGLVINPNFVKAQIEGSIIWSLSALLNPAINLESGSVKQSNFHDYPVIRMDQIPVIEVHVLQSDREPNRVGEAAVPDTAPAVLNAIFNATGIRIRELPIPNKIVGGRSFIEK